MKNLLIIFTIILFLAVNTVQSKTTPPFSILCTPIEEGVRVDFQKEKNKFVEKYDKNSLNIFRVNFNFSSEPNVTITVIPTVDGKKEGFKEEEYLAELIHYSDRLMIVKLKLPQGLDKFQMLSICIDQHVAYLISTATYMGLPNGETLSEANPDVPETSAYVFPMTAVIIQ